MKLSIKLIACIVPVKSVLIKMLDIICNHLQKHCPTHPCSEFRKSNCFVDFNANHVGFIAAKEKEFRLVILHNQVVDDIWCNVNKAILSTVILWIVVKVDLMASAGKKNVFLLPYLMDLAFLDYFIKFNLHKFPPKPISDVTKQQNNELVCSGQV